jgi:CubicO group peptidase (beta-lactamase class C family)
MSRHQASALRAAGRDAVANGDVPGVVSVVCHRGEVVHAEAAGLRDIDKQLPMDLSTVFGIASMSKPVTVVLALALLEEGRLCLDDPITRWLPEFGAMRVLRRPDGPLDDTLPSPRVITVEDLMTHRSGLAYGFLTPGPLGGALFSNFGMGISSPLSPDAWLAKLAELPLAHAPGERFTYGHSTDVLGFLAARAAGTTLRNALRQRVFEPLGMADTDFWIPPAKRTRMAQIYSSPAPGRFAAAGIAHFTADEPAAYTSGGQGLVSTADDYLAFARMLLGGGMVDGVRLLQPSTVQLMTTNRLTAAQRELPFLGGPFFKARGFGLGVSMVTDSPPGGEPAGRGSFGWPGGFGGWWQADPANELVLLWLQECVPASPLAAPGTVPRMPGARAIIDFQRQAYAALPR